MTLVDSGKDGTTPLLMINAATVIELFDLDLAIRSQRDAFTQLGAGRAHLAPRILLHGSGGAVSFSYTARMQPGAGAISKFGSVVPANAGTERSVVSAVVVVLDDETGHLSAIVDGTALTTLRTAAASAVAAAALAGPNPSTAAILGSGVQAQAHVRALQRELGIADFRMWSPNESNLASAIHALAAAGIEVTPAADPQKAVAGADVVVACTSSTTPVLDASWVKPGSLVISVGSFAPDRHEIGVDVLARAATVVVDHVDTALEQAGPIMAAVAEDFISAERIVSLGEVLVGMAVPRTRPDDIVVYNSVGIGVQDAAAALAIIERARSSGTVPTLDW